MINRKILVITALCTGMVFAQSFGQKEQGHEEAPTNLKVLPKNTSAEEVHKIMHIYSMSLGVHCNFCHVGHQVEGQQRPKMDFASDEKPEKNIARDMMKMVDSINANYIGKMKGADHQPLELITCVTCHNGKASPIASVDSLPKKQ